MSDKRVFTYPTWINIALTAMLILQVSLLTYAIQRGNSTSLDLLGFLFVSVACILGILYFERLKVIVDDQAIIYRGLKSFVSLDWADIDDVHSSPHWIVLSSTRKQKQISLMRGEYGITFQPFDDLQQLICEKTRARLLDEWERAPVRQKCVCPGIPWRTVIAYTIPLGLLLIFAVLFVTMTEGMLFGKILFALLGTLVIMPFLIRDYRANQKTVMFDDSGIRERNGGDKFIPWAEAASIVVKEPALGYGKIVVSSREGVRIQIPMSHIRMKCGQVLHLIRKQTGLKERFGYE